MKQTGMGYAAAAVGMLLVGTAVWAAGGTWVADTGKVHAVGHDTMFFGEGATEIQMSDLADGETRVIGRGEKQLTAARRGDLVTITRGRSGDNEPLSVKCTIGQDTCKVITFADDPEKVMLVVQQTRRCKDGDGDCADVEVMALGHGMHGENRFIMKGDADSGDGAHVIRIHKSVNCVDDGDCSDVDIQVLGDGDGDGAMAEMIIETLGDGAPGHHGQMVFIGKTDQVTLRCAEGDTTMHVDKQEADDVFLCPKHSTPLEQVKGHPRVMRHKIRRDTGSN